MIPEPAEPVAPSQPPAAVPYVSYAVLAGSVIVFLLDSFVLDNGLRGALGLYGPLVKQGQWWRPLTFVFTHGGPLHLGLNMMVVMSLGRDVERGVGTFRFLISSIVGALASAVAVLIWDFDQPTVGASGMILGWAGVLVPIIGTAGRKQLGIWLVQMALISLIPGISGAGHLGGFLGGLPCGFIMRGSKTRFQTMAPVLLFIAAVLTVLAGTGRLSL